jgi:hypothetical protein
MEASSELKAFMQVLCRVDARGVLNSEFYASLTLDVKNSWRSGSAVHGRRYGAAEKHLAVACLFDLRQARMLKNLLAVNNMTALPTRHTIERHLGGACGAAVSGVQSGRFLAATFEASLRQHEHPEAGSPPGQGGRRLHLCVDEASVNTKLEYLRHAEGYEVIGLANRTARMACPSAVQTIIVEGTAEDGGQVILSTAEGQETRDIRELQHILHEEARATLICCWLLFEPVRGGSVVLA